MERADEDTENGGEEEFGFSLEELSQSYSQAVARGGDSPASSQSGQSPAPAEEQQDDDAEIQIFDPLEDELDATATLPVTPQAVVEAILFVGQADNNPISAAAIAKLMRGVSEAEVHEIVVELNQSYAQTGRAMQIVEVAGGFQMQLASDLEFLKERFYGRVREVKLSQAAIDCLALVSYQPGISREKLEEQRGPSGSVLNQLVRRQLLEMRRQPLGTKMVPHYFPTDRLLELTGLSSLDDLPQSEDF